MYVELQCTEYMLYITNISSYTLLHYTQLYYTYIYMYWVGKIVKILHQP